MNEQIDQIGLELISGLGPHGVKQLISYCGSASEVFATPKNKLLKIPGVGSKLVNAISNSRHQKTAEKIIAEVSNLGGYILHYTNKKYPYRLRLLSDSPNILYVKGQGSINPSKCIAIVGTRKSTEYGKQITEKIVTDLKNMDVTVVSGLAYGIDIIAHKACLKNEVSTLGVLASSIDRIYPSEHAKYANQMQIEGAIISESLPGTGPERHLFPSRNRIIAGMADATIVVEAAKKGGALITANIADSYNRPVFAVPGNIGNSYSEGTNDLIANQKALIYNGIEDLIFHLNWDQTTTKTKKEIPLQNLTDNEKIIYDLLEKEGKTLEIDMIAIKSQIPINKVASILLNMELKNVVYCSPGKKFSIKKIN